MRRHAPIRPTSIKRAGPYRVDSLADGSLLVIPAWPEFSKWTPADGGGPGIMSRLGLARALGEWLNGKEASDEASD
jgi:hypothetical protein